MKLNLSEFGKKLKLTHRAKKQDEINEKDLFVELVGSMDHCWERSNTLYEVYGLNTLEFEEDYYKIMESLLLIKYGLWKTEVILWFVFGRKDEEGTEYPLTVQNLGEEDKEVFLNTSLELWDFLNEMDNESKETDE
jgi:hypothetical protein